LEAGSFDEPNKSQVYGILNTITEDGFKFSISGFSGNCT
jgi:hypothetical protein